MIFGVPCLLRYSRALKYRAASSAVERFVYTEDVGGSKPSLPTIVITVEVWFQKLTFSSDHFHVGYGPDPSWILSPFKKCM